ncbi:MAG: 5-formyltetrahydrofolate cyclo-ligase [Hyphomicrobiaceae bacterium]
MDDVLLRKKDLRTAAIAKRSAAHLRHGASAGVLLAAHGIDFAGQAPQQASVSAFLPIGEEIDPLPLMRRLWARGHQVGLPVMVGKARPLVFRAWRDGEALQEVKWGIREPLPTAPEVLPDVMLVPLLAFDASGMRLGYGGGFYDRTIAQIRAVKPVVTIGIAYDELQVDAVPHSDYDERLDWVLTPSGPKACRRI